MLDRVTKENAENAHRANAHYTSSMNVVAKRRRTCVAEEKNLQRVRIDATQRNPEAVRTSDHHK